MRRSKLPEMLKLYRVLFSVYIEPESTYFVLNQLYLSCIWLIKWP